MNIYDIIDNAKTENASLKTKLYLTVYTKDVNNMHATLDTYLQATTYSYNDDKKLVETKTRKKKVSTSPYITKDVRKEYTEFFTAYVEYILPRLCYTALNTIYSNSCDEVVLYLMYDLVRYARSSENTKEQFEQMLSSEKNNSPVILDYMTDRQKEGRTQSELTEIQKQIQYAKNRVTSITKVHTKARKKDIFGNSYTVEIIPKFEQVKTQYGKTIDKEEQKKDSIKLDDVLQEGRKALFELFSMDLLNSPSDIYNYSTYVYKAINTYIHKEKSISVKESDSIYYTSSKGKETEKTYTEKILSVKQVDKMLNNVEKNDCFNHIKKALFSALDKRSNKENILKTFDLIYIYGLSVRDAAKIMRVHYTTVDNYNNQIKKALKHPFIYESLNHCINDSNNQ